MKTNQRIKLISVLSILIMAALLLSFTACENKSNTDYKALSGYKEYISDSDKGYEDLPYFYVTDSMEESEEAREYFRANNRQCGEYIITDYEDGVCINKYRLNHTISVLDTLDVPETLDGKPVVKIGGYLQEDSQDSLLPYEVISAFGGLRGCTLNLPKTVKVITADSIDSCSFALEDDERVKFPVFIGINVDKENPYYFSEDGVLYSKDKKKLLFMNFDYESDNYKVPEFIESFEPVLGVPCGLTSIEIGKNVKSINTYIDRGEGETPNIVVRGYKGTAAEEWAKQENVKFEALD